MEGDSSNIKPVMKCQQNMTSLACLLWYCP